MLVKITNPDIKSFEEKYLIKDDVYINAKIIFKYDFSGRKALYIHGGGIYGDHSLVVRPAEWLINNNIFDTVILPDRRGSGKSSLFRYPATLKEQGEELHLLLDKLRIDENITVIGSSYGGLIALLLADIDKRVEKVILIGSSPSLKDPTLIIKILGKIGLLKLMLKLLLWIYIGRDFPSRINQDEFYDLKSLSEFKKMALKILKHLNRNELQSMNLKIDALFDKKNLSVPGNIKLNIPIIQIIGSKDEFWGKDIPEVYKKNLPFLKQSIIKGTSHKDIIFKADVFHMEMVRLLSEF